jgi:hypothetical protein
LRFNGSGWPTNRRAQTQQANEPEPERTVTAFPTPCEIAQLGCTRTAVADLFRFPQVRSSVHAVGGAGGRHTWPVRQKLSFRRIQLEEQTLCGAKNAELRQLSEAGEDSPWVSGLLWVMTTISANKAILLDRAAVVKNSLEPFQPPKQDPRGRPRVVSANSPASGSNATAGTLRVLRLTLNSLILAPSFGTPSYG